MKIIFIDANIFLEVELQQNQAEECKELLTFLETSSPCAWTNSFIVFSMVITIQHKTQNMDKSKKLIEILNSYTGLIVYSPNLTTIYEAISEQEKNNLDFDDGLVIACMKEISIQDIVTFDTHFEDIPGINKLSPSKALTELKNQNQKI